MKESVLGLQEKSQHNIGFPTFKLPESTKNILDNFGIRLLGYIIFLSVLTI